MVKGKQDIAIPALPASYAGVIFRSRLEARWAHYFDLIGLPWQYEPQGFALEAGNYCPDFLCHDYYVEVKPTISDLVTAYPKLAELSKVTGATVFCVVDHPTVIPQRYWQDGREAGKASFCEYAFNGKGWTFPYITDEYEDMACAHLAERATKIRFSRSGIAEVDWEVLRARNAVIRKRQEAHKAGAELEGDDWTAHYHAEIDPLNKRLASLNKLAGL